MKVVLKKIIFSGMLLLIAVAGLFAQRNMHPAYLVLNTGDTLKGFIHYREWHKNPEAVQFAESKDAPLKRYDRSNMNYFEITGKETYKRYYVTISIDPISYNSLGEKNTEFRTDSVFLREIFKGDKVSLLSYEDDLKDRYYLLWDTAKSPEELKNSVYLVDSKIYNEREYQKQLLAIAKELQLPVAAIIDVINKTTYDRKSLLALTYQLNGIQEAPKNKNDKVSNIRFIAGAGINRSAFAFSSENMYSGSGSTSHISPLVIAGIDLFINPHIGKMTLRNTVSFTNNTLRFTAQKKYYEATEKYTYDLKQTNLSIQTQLTYHLYNQPNFKWFIGGGAGVNFSSYPQNRQTYVRQGLSDTSTFIENTHLGALKKVWMNLSARTGFTIKNVEAGLCYIPKASITAHRLFELESTSMQLQIIYLFPIRKKKAPTSL